MGICNRYLLRGEQQMYNNEILFVKKFLSALKKLKVDKIPFKNDRYRAGVQSMQMYFENYESTITPKCRDIQLLFLDDGEGDLAEAIMDSNDGRIVSFELKNPYYENASVKIDDDVAELLLSDEELKLSNDFIYEMAKAFCNGAKLEYAQALS